MRERMCLNFGWRYINEYKPGYVRPDFVDTTFKLVDIPHTMRELSFNYVDEKSYQGVGCYRKMFILPTSMDNKRIILHFEGVMARAAVFVNGKQVTVHKGGYTPFCCDITEHLHDEENLLTVVVDASERGDVPPFGGSIDYLCYGGIYREVWLEAVEEVHMSDLFVRTVPCGNMWKLQVVGSLSMASTQEYKVYLFDGEKKIASKYFSCDTKDFSFDWEVPVELETWSLENPKLYTVMVELSNGDKLVRRVGMRTVSFTHEGFFLNGQKIKLRGLNRHQSYPYVGYAMPARAQRLDADMLKELGCNVVRTSHYPQSTHFLDRCDEIGLLVFEEFPGWNYIGDDEWKECAKDTLREMIVRDRCHPSIIMWGVRINESVDDDEFYTQTNAIAHQLDPTRPTGGVRNFTGSNLLEDVYTFNDFTHAGGKDVLNSRKNVAGARVPYMVSEHNGHKYPTKSFDREAVRVEHALRHARVLDAMYGDKEIAGCIGWCFCDYNTHPGFGSGDKICYHGVTDMFRMRKLAAAVYESQQEERPVLTVGSTIANGDYDDGCLTEVYVFTNCDEVRLYCADAYVGTFKPDRKNFPNMPHPPVVIDDFIGGLLEANEGFSHKDAQALKDMMTSTGGNAAKLTTSQKMKLASIMKRYSLSYANIVELYTKYTSAWDAQAYRFEGVKNGEVVCTSICDAVRETKLEVTISNTELLHAETYDIACVQLRAVDQNGNVLPYCFDAVSVDTEGSLEVVGPKMFSLMAGVKSFYVRTKGGRGEAQIIINTESLGKRTLYVNVERMTQRDINFSRLDSQSKQ